MSPSPALQRVCLPALFSVAFARSKAASFRELPCCPGVAAFSAFAQVSYFSVFQRSMPCFLSAEESRPVFRSSSSQS